jgi:hypothetical protein
LAWLIVAGELLFVTAVAFSVDTEARIRATVAAGETLVAALDAYARQTGTLPASLDLLVPGYLSSVPLPRYGIRSWEYAPASMTAERADERRRIEWTLRDSKSTQVDMKYSLSVRLDPDNPTTRFYRTSEGCWRLPELPKCW